MDSDDKPEKIERVVIFILYIGFFLMVFFVILALLTLNDVSLSFGDGSLWSSIFSFISSLGVIATLWVYWKQKIKSDTDARAKLEKKENAIKKLYTQEIAKTVEIYDEIKNLIDYAKNNTITNKQRLVVIHNISPSYVISIININNTGIEKLLTVQKRDRDTLKGILLNSTDISDELYEHIFSCLNAITDITQLMSSFFSLAKRDPKNTSQDKEMVYCDLSFLETFFIGTGTNDQVSQLNIIRNRQTIKDIYKQYQ